MKKGIGRVGVKCITLPASSCIIYKPLKREGTSLTEQYFIIFLPSRHI